MNSNRMKYASTPTYGMQKRNFAKKAPAAQDTPTPDFTQQPALDMNAPIAPFTAQNPFAAQPNLFPGMGQPQSAPFYQNAGQPQQAMGSQPVFTAAPMPYPMPAQAMPQQNMPGYMQAGSYFPQQPLQAGQAMNTAPYASGMQGTCPLSMRKTARARPPSCAANPWGRNRCRGPTACTAAPIPASDFRAAERSPAMLRCRIPR